MKGIRFATLVIHLSSFYGQKISREKNSIKHILINKHLHFTLSRQKRRPVSGLLIAAVRSRLWSVPILRIILLFQVLCLCEYSVADSVVIINCLENHQKQNASLPLSQIQTTIATFIKDTDWKAKKRGNYRDIKCRLSLFKITNVEFL